MTPHRRGYEELLSAEQWDPNSAKVLAYIQQCVSDFNHTLMEENAFNDLRDNESRGAKHKQRGEHCISAVAFASARTRFPKINQVEVKPEDVAQYANVQCRSSTFHPEKMDHRSERLLVDAKSILGRATWTATTWDAMAQHGAPLLRALLETPEHLWSKLWITGLLPTTAIIGVPAEESLWMVLAVTETRLFALRMSEIQDNVATLDIGVDFFREWGMKKHMWFSI